MDHISKSRHDEVRGRQRPQPVFRVDRDDLRVDLPQAHKYDTRIQANPNYPTHLRLSRCCYPLKPISSEICTKSRSTLDQTHIGLERLFQTFADRSVSTNRTNLLFLLSEYADIVLLNLARPDTIKYDGRGYNIRFQTLAMVPTSCETIAVSEQY